MSNEIQTVEMFDEFVYLGSQVNSAKDVNQEIHRRNGGIPPMLLRSPEALRNRYATIAIKLRVNKTLIMVVLINGSECWQSLEPRHRFIYLFIRIYKRIFGAVCYNGVWRQQRNA